MKRFLISSLLCAAFCFISCEKEKIRVPGGEDYETEDLANSSVSLRSIHTNDNTVHCILTEGNGFIVEGLRATINTPSPIDQTIVLKADPSLVEAYAEENGIEYEPLHPAFYSFGNDGSFEVKAGETYSDPVELTFYGQSKVGNRISEGRYLLPVVAAASSETVSRDVIYFDITVRKPFVGEADLHEGEDIFFVFYLNTSQYDPRLVTDYYMMKSLISASDEVWFKAIGNIVNLKRTVVEYNEDTDRAILNMSSDMEYVLNNYSKYILPVRETGRKVCLCIEGDGSGLGFCNMTDAQIKDFVAQIKLVFDLHELDGINLWDKNSGYGKEGSILPPMNTTSYPKLIKALREMLGPDKLLTVTDYEEPTEYFWDTEATGGIIVGDNINMMNQGYYMNPIVSAYLFPVGEDFTKYRTFEVYNPDKRISEQVWPFIDLNQNPYWVVNRNPHNNDRHRYTASASVKYDFFEWLNVAARFKVDNTSAEHIRKIYATSSRGQTDCGQYGHYTEARRSDSQMYADFMANFDKTFAGEWSIAATLGVSYNRIKSNIFQNSGQLEHIANSFCVESIDGDTMSKTKESWNDRIMSAFGMFELGWKKMLYLTLTARNDWTKYYFGRIRTSALYPSAGLSWVPTSVWDMDFVNYLKIRASLAGTGLPYGRFGEMDSVPYSAVNNSFEAGFDMRFCNDFSIGLTAYCDNTKHMSSSDGRVMASTIDGKPLFYFGSHIRNVGIELRLGYEHSWGDFTLCSDFMWSLNENKVIKLIDSYNSPLVEVEIVERYRMGYANCQVTNGGGLGDLYSSTFMAIDKNGALTVRNHDDIIGTKLGSVFPNSMLSWRNQFSYKGLNLGVLLTGRIGGVGYSYTQATMNEFGVSEESAAARDAGGVIFEGKKFDSNEWFIKESDVPQYNTFSATNFRLQELSLGYTLPTKWFRNKVALRLSLVGNNLLMIWCEAPFDPETVPSTGNLYMGMDYFKMPSLRRIGFNVKLDF